MAAVAARALGIESRSSAPPGRMFFAGSPVNPPPNRLPEYAMKSLFKIWLYSLGSFSDEKTAPYDKSILLVRTFWVMLHILTCLMIIIGNGRLLDWW